MVKDMTILREALNDKVAKEIDVISLDNLSIVKNALKNYPNASYFSEWKIELAGKVRYSYRVHEGDIGKMIFDVYSKGVSSSLPKLTYVYSREELKNLVLL